MPRAPKQCDNDVEPMSNEIGVLFHGIVHEDCPVSQFTKSTYTENQCSSDNSFSFEDFFSFLKPYNSLDRLKIIDSFLTFTPKSESNVNKETKKSENILSYIQPMQIEAFRANFD
jgi:hypothetical protein